MITVRSNGVSIASILFEHVPQALSRSCDFDVVIPMVIVITTILLLITVIATLFFQYLPSGNSNHGASSFDRINHHRIRAHGHMVAHADAAQNLAARTEHYVVADFGSQSSIETHIQLFRAQRNALKNRHVAADAPCSNHGS